MPIRMDGSTFLGLAATHNPHRWVLPVRPSIATGHKFLFGGCGLAAAAEALQRTCERPLVWATAQYLAFAMVDEVVDRVVLAVRPQPVEGEAVEPAGGNG